MAAVIVSCGRDSLHAGRDFLCRSSLFLPRRRNRRRYSLT